jgi:hypothetical protein
MLATRRRQCTIIVCPSTRGVEKVVFGFEALIVTLGVLLYFVIRGLVTSSPELAYGNAARLIDLEQRLGLFHEAAVQQWALDWPILPSVANWIYIWGHWPVIVATLIWLAVWHPSRYPMFRNAMIVSGLCGFLFFAAFPVAPPRLLADGGFVDTITLQSNAYRVLQPPSLANPYAALPSFHFGWNLLMGIAIFRYARSRWVSAIGLLLPIAMFWSIVTTANHFIVDGLVGGLIVLTSLWLVGEHRRGARFVSRLVFGDARQ